MNITEESGVWRVRTDPHGTGTFVENLKTGKIKKLTKVPTHSEVARINGSNFAKCCSKAIITGIWPEGNK